MTLLVPLGLALACAGGEESAELPGEAIPRELNGACTEADLTPQTCSGPWEYRRYNEPCYALVADAHCPMTDNGLRTCNNTCRLPHFGVEHYSLLKHVQELVEPSWCSTWGYFKTKTCTYDVSCQNRANQLKVQLDPENDDNLKVEWSSVGQKTWPRGKPGRGTCTVTISKPVYNLRTDPACGTHACNVPPTFAACRTWQHGEAANPAECGVHPAVHFSKPGRSRSAVVAELSQDKYFDASSVVCLSAEDLPVADAQQVQQKYQRLVLSRAQLTSGAAAGAVASDPQLDEKLIRNLKLLLELKGDLLTPAQRALIIDELAVGYPGVQPVCGNSWQAPSQSAAVGLLQLCHRMLQDHVRPEILELSVGAEAAIVQRCVDLLGTTKALPTTLPERLSLLSKAQGVSVAAMQKAFSVVPGSDAAARRQSLQRHLWTLNRWFDDARTGVYAAPGDAAHEALWKDTSDVVGAIWKAHHAPAYEDFKLTKNAAAFREAGLAADREMFSALFSDYVPLAGAATTEPPLRSAPALLLLSDSLTALVERLNSTAVYHDVGCRFLDCGKAPPATELTRLYALIAALPDAGQLSAALQAGDLGEKNPSTQGYFSSNWPTYRSLFAQVIAPSSADAAITRHAQVLQAAVRSALDTTAPYDPAHLHSVAPSSPTPLVGLGATLRTAAIRLDRYARTGMLLHEGTQSLPTGLLAGSLERLRTSVQTAVGGLEGAIASYQSNQAKVTADLVAELDSEVVTTNLEARKRALGLKALALATDLAGLRVGASQALTRFTDLNHELQTVAQSMEEGGSPLVSKRVINPITVDGQGGRYPTTAHGPVTHIPDIALPLSTHPTKPASGALLTGKPGEVVNLSVQGAYQPTCALQALNGSYHGMPVNPVTGNGAPIAEAEAASNGFRFQWNTSSFDVDTNTRSSTHTVNAGVQGCATYSTPELMKGTWGSVTASVQACAGYNYSRTWGSSDSTGNDARNTAAFELGLHLPGTPFPSYPAGALLAVLVKEGSTLSSEVYDVQVVQQPSTTITFSRAADVYLVVNDSDCATAGTSKTLTLSGAHLVPQTSLLTQVGAAMQTVDRALHESPDGVTPGKADLLVAQGRLLPGDVSALRNQAWQDLSLSCPACAAPQLASVARGLFETWLDWQVQRIEREIELRHLLRELDQVTLEAEALERDLETLGRKGRMADLQVHWSLRNLDLANADVTQGTEQVVRLVVDQLYPMAALRYPEALVGLNTPKALLGLDWVKGAVGSTSVPSVIASHVKLVTAEFMNALEIAVNNSTSLNSPTRDAIETYAVVRFPDPFRQVFDPVDTTVGRKVDEMRARALWEPILDFLEYGIERPIEVTLRPSDLYQSGTTNGLLGCNFVAPAIKDFAIYMVTNATNAQTFSIQDIKVPTSVLGTMDFTTTTGLAQFSLANADFLETGRTKVYFGREESWKTGFDALTGTDLSESIRGVSPFTTFTLESLKHSADPWFGSIADDQTKELVVVMRIEARQKSPGVSGVPTCP